MQKTRRVLFPRLFPVFLAAQRDGHGLHTATARHVSRTEIHYRCKSVSLASIGGLGWVWCWVGYWVGEPSADP